MHAIVLSFPETGVIDYFYGLTMLYFNLTLYRKPYTNLIPYVRLRKHFFLAWLALGFLALELE